MQFSTQMDKSVSRRKDSTGAEEEEETQFTTQRTANEPRPVLTVSPSWLSPGASVTLNCEVKHPSAGWSFYWYKAVRNLSEKSSSYELLPDGSGTAQDSYIIHGQTHTAGYVCRAGRGDPEYHTDHSRPKFVWSADVHSAASLTVSPDRVQHFTSDSVSLTCEGNFTEWRVRKFSEDGRLSDCRRMTGSTCNIHTSKSDTAVYWCESGSGEFSSAVNITVQNDGNGPILVSPVHPVTEGASVSLSCSLRTQKILSNVFFYHNDKRIQNDPRGELKISAVSKSDEGFYKCQYSGRESAQSWMSVKGADSSSSPVWLMVGLVCGVSLIIILLLLLYRCRQSKCADKPRDVIYSNIELENFGNKWKHHKPEQSAVYANVKTGAAAVISETLGYKLNSHKGQYPPWRRRLEGKIKVARREVSQLTELQKGATKKVHKKYSKLSIPEALETAKQRLTALASRLRRYTREIEGRRINQLFSTEPAKVYSQWQGNNKRTAPPRLETEQYWKSIWEKDATHNGNAQWLVDLRADHSDLPEQGPVTITVADIQERVSSMKSWTAPGPDMVHAYWLKKLTALHERLAAQMNQLLVNERHPEWLTEGRTVLIPKDPKKGPVPSNYRPITCLSTTWKLLSGIISAKMNRHMGQYMSGTQKGIGKNTRGAKHQLLVDRTVSRDCKTRLTNLCTAWIDYKKAYDSMPHSWILECLELYKINGTLRAFIKNSMGMWRTTLEANSN
ncbi:uncharacterized protein LOC143414044 [Maylandia zebra]|uniref:uncharacterized protein LOC143414044 n=1 Tax=Maylandia zebra TaxID=106582 RepID=UPI00403D3B74